METNAYITFLVLATLLVVVDGQIIYRSGRRYLEHSYGDPAAGASMTRLITVLFHLAVLGVLALLSTIDSGGDNATEAVVWKLGITLLVLAIAHGVTLTVLARIRDNQVAERALKQQQHPTSAASETTVAPVPGQQGVNPRVSPALDQRDPYSA
ncbi:hypothetical protein [Amycolatopsis albispora]|uniref:Uncharacterized protein n=1 Tax=Amycolatopsis albispora TaxID=1804986 RepID=A0A344L8P5_9PSEU|nr:hypothetical protein [Amycolatopsis albispora]AXB44419.1 hypothetical protein A4R43_19410 [Amycolatopsis albispora]